MTPEIQELRTQLEEHYHNGVVGKRIDLKDLTGHLKVITVAADLTARLAGKPRDFPDQVLLDTTTGTTKLYVYNATAGTWNSLSFGSSAYGGYVNANGTAGTPMPSGWTTAKTGTGAYTITHNLNTTSYVVVATAAGASFHVGAIYAINANTFDISWVTMAASLQDAAFTFILLPQ